MGSDQIQKYISHATKFLLGMLSLLLLLTMFDIESNKKPPEEISKALDEQRSRYAAFKLDEENNIKNSTSNTWPPKMNNPYPEIELFDQSGQAFSLSDLKGRIIIIEYIDMTSPISQAQSGAGLFGAYNASANQDVDKYAMPIADILRKETDNSIMLPHDQIVQVKVIIYGENSGAGSRDDATNWAKHFSMDKSDNIIVAVPKNDMRGKDSDKILTGFQLIDSNMVLRVDSSGAIPKHNLKMTLVPLIPKLLD